MKFMDFLENIYRYGLEYYRRYYGPYRARVISNKDPQNRGRIVVEVPRALYAASITGGQVDADNRWVSPMTPAGEGHGVFWPPEEGEAVWVFFDNGDPNIPLCYIGGWFYKNELPDSMTPAADGTPSKRGFVTKAGNRIILDDTNGAETIIIHQKDGKQIKVTKDKVSIGSENGAYEPMFKASTVKEWLISHTHPSPFGPTGPATQPFPDDGLSDDVENS